jgi:uncharacterized RDD family membrane protein YckC
MPILADVGASIITVFIVVPLFVSGVAGLRVHAGDGYRQTPAVAWFCTLAIDVLMLIVGFATTPQSECSGTGCDTGYGVGVMFVSVPLFVLTLAGVAVGRLVARRRGWNENDARLAADPPRRDL